MSERPNILYVFTDQQSAFAMSCMGNTDVQTPTMDRLAAEGVLFEHAYCTQPLCTPCRGSMFTGMMPHECGTGRNGLAIHEHLRSQELGVLLGANGYDCIYGGKWHVPEGAMPADNDHGFRTICGFDDNNLADSCIAYLDEHQQEPDGQPFFLVASYDNPHNICEWGRSMRLPRGPIGEPPPLEQCPNLPKNFGIPAFEPEILRVEQERNWQINPYRQHTPEDWRRLRWAYYRLVEKVDRQIGEIIDALDARGLLDNTLVILSSDHGDGHGSHQWNQKSVLYEEVTRIPMIVRPPGGRDGLVDRTHLVSNGLDIFPTVCDYADVALPEGLRGHSLRPLAEDRDPGAWREAAFVETYFDGGRGYGTMGRVVRTARHKYIVYDRGRYREQLFDLQEDPGEMLNLAVEARHRATLEAHRELLRQQMAATDDQFPVPGDNDGDAYAW